MEAIATKYGFNAEGGSKNFNFATQDTHSDLHDFIRLERGVLHEVMAFSSGPRASITWRRKLIDSESNARAAGIHFTDSLMAKHFCHCFNTGFRVMEFTWWTSRRQRSHHSGS